MTSTTRFIPATIPAELPATEATAAENPPAEQPAARTALSVRRWFLVASPVLAGLFAVLGAAMDPAAGSAGEKMFQIYADNPEPLQWKSIGFHWSYAFWMAPALLVAQLVRGRGVWIANLGALLGFIGMTTLPGLLFADYYDSAIGQLYGVEGTVAIQDHMTATMWGVPYLILPGIIGLLTALPVAALGLWRARLVRWWAPVAVVAGTAAFMLSNVMWWGCLITTACFTAFAVALARATRP